MMFNLFSKCSKFNADSKRTIKKQQNVFDVFDNCIWIGNGKSSVYYDENTCVKRCC